MKGRAKRPTIWDSGSIHNGLSIRNFGVALFGLALLFGGTQSTAAFFHLIIELTAIALLVRLLLAKSLFFSPEHRPALLLLAATFLLLILQLVPLPPDLWRNLSGRDVSSAIAALIDQEEAWRPLTVDPRATWQALLSLIPFAAIFLCTLHLNTGARRTIAKLLVVGALVSLALSFVQVASPSGAWRFYRGSHDNLPVGLFANRNHQADLLLLGILFSAGLMQMVNLEPWRRWLLWLGLAAALTAGVVATNSRTGLVLLPLVILGSLAILIPRKTTRGRGLTSWMILGLASLAAMMGFAIMMSGAMGRTLVRFGLETDVRATIWPETLYAAKQYLPFGSGAGTFELVYETVENLNDVSPLFANHAHNDFLEIWLELGVPGAILIVAFLALFAFRAVRRNLGEQRPLHVAAVAGILLLLAHSTFDYPVRTYSLMVIFGYLCGLLFPPSAVPRREKQAHSRPAR